ncbi:hypothetical protein EGW08_010766 [Elysia chlorotica]|uniref:Reverse transcriptase domain-containing protein n=1 Tax=Elysia chlorotica TaxID=188477 RepID=A0A433TIQ3_ELYCH|nr:hypothetical protein EGW08_010766 [Elysia chlorotica]
MSDADDDSRSSLTASAGRGSNSGCSSGAETDDFQRSFDCAEQELLYVSRHGKRSRLLSMLVASEEADEVDKLNINCKGGTLWSLVKSTRKYRMAFRGPVLVYLANHAEGKRASSIERCGGFRASASNAGEIPNEVAYADDVDFIGQSYADINKIQEVLKKYQLKVNTDKTEYTSLSKSEEGWKEVKKVGSLIDDDKDVERRKQLATAALNKLNNVWIKGNKTENLN